MPPVTLAASASMSLLEVNMTEPEFLMLSAARDDLKISIEDAEDALEIVEQAMEEGIGSRITSLERWRK
jgi:hypothetical protein